MPNATVMQSATAMQNATMRGAGRFVQMPTRDIVAAPARRPVAFSLTDYAEAMRTLRATLVKRSKTPLIPAKARESRGHALGPRNGVPATLASRGAPRGDERKRVACDTTEHRQ